MVLQFSAHEKISLNQQHTSELVSHALIELHRRAEIILLNIAHRPSEWHPG